MSGGFFGRGVGGRSWFLLRTDKSVFVKERARACYCLLCGLLSVLCIAVREKRGREGGLYANLVSL